MNISPFLLWPTREQSPLILYQQSDSE